MKFFKTLSAVVMPLAVLAAPLQKKDDGLVVFANAFLSAHTGGHFNDFTSIVTAASLGASTGIDRANLFNTWALNQCRYSYNNHAICYESSAYLAATFWAYENSWAAVDYFASLGAARLDRWHNSLVGLCGINGCPQNSCGAIVQQWAVYYASYTSVTAQQCATQTWAFTNYGIFAFIDAYLNVGISASASTSTNGHGSANVVTGLTNGLALGGVLGGKKGGKILGLRTGHGLDFDGKAAAVVVAGASGDHFDAKTGAVVVANANGDHINAGVVSSGQVGIKGRSGLGGLGGIVSGLKLDTVLEGGLIGGGYTHGIL